MFQKKYVGWVLMIVVSVSPLIPWFFALQPISLRFANTYATFTAIGEILGLVGIAIDRKSTRLNSSHQIISYAVFCLKKKKCDRLITRFHFTAHCLYAL